MAGGRLALVIAYGPEARAFLQSGLAALLSEDWEVVVLTPEPASAAFAGRRETVLPMPLAGESRKMGRIRGWSRGVRRRAPGLSALAMALERRAGKVWGGGPWGRLFDELAIDTVIVASAAGSRTLPALQAAANLGLTSTALLNSWKDLSVRGELPAPVTALGVVTRDDLNRIGPGRGRADMTEVVGSLHHAAVRRAPSMPRTAFCGALGLDPCRPIVLYATAANDDAEHGRLAWLADSLADMPARPQLLIRPNPMDNAGGAYAAIAQRPGVALLRPQWEWFRDREWNCPLPADLPWWRGALDHAAFAVTLPSTIALDFAAWGKPTVNLVWGRGAPLWGADGYAPIRETAGVVGEETPCSTAARIARLLREPIAFARRRDDPVKAALRLIRDASLRQTPDGQSRWARPRLVTP